MFTLLAGWMLWNEYAFFADHADATGIVSQKRWIRSQGRGSDTYLLTVNWQEGGHAHTNELSTDEKTWADRKIGSTVAIEYRNPADVRLKGSSGSAVAVFLPVGLLFYGVGFWLFRRNRKASRALA